MSEEQPGSVQPAESARLEQQVGDRWGDPISEERATTLSELADRQHQWVRRPEATRGDSLFKGVQLTGADVFWLAKESGLSDSGSAPSLHLEGANLDRAHLERARLDRAHLEGTRLDRAHLEGASLFWAYLERAYLAAAHLEGANLGGAHLEVVYLGGAHLEGATLDEAHLEQASLTGAHLEGAYLLRAHLEGASLGEAHLEGASLSAAHLEGANLREAHLEGKQVPADEVRRLRQTSKDFPALLAPTDLRGAFFSTATILAGVTLGSPEYGFVQVADVRWGGVNLAVVKWTQQGTGKQRNRVNAVVLGDEWQAREAKDGNGKPKSAARRLADYESAVRANRQLATVLRDQGLNEDADRFAYRAQFLQREVLRRQRKWGQAFGSWLLDAVSGYGYQPMRSVIAYVLIIGLFAGAYLLNAQFAAPHLTWDEALVLSISSFHGRGFFTSGINLGDTLARLAAGEAIIGLLIEITFIATFTNRFFAR